MVYAGKVSGVTAPGKVMGVSLANIAKVKGVQFVDPLTVAIFQTILATGTCEWPEHINNNDTTTYADFYAPGAYAEVDFGAVYGITQYQHFGDDWNAENGRWKLQYWDGAAWQDWETEIPTRTTPDWSGWISPAAGAIITSKIRLVATILGTPDYLNTMPELEMKYQMGVTNPAKVMGISVGDIAKVKGVESS